MGIISALIIGLIAGALFQLLRPGDDALGLAITGGLGVAGALLALSVGTHAGWFHDDGEGHGILGCGVGAAAALTLYRLGGGRA